VASGDRIAPARVIAKAIYSETKGRTPPTMISRRRSTIRTQTRLREELYRILGEARAAKTIPWDANRTGLYRTIFPQMTGCLPEDEGAQLRFDFETEMARLEAA
jgi:hypothetical protein